MCFKFRKFICKIFGHSFDSLDKMIFRIETQAINKDFWKDARIKCQRCGTEFIHKECKDD